MIDPRTRNDLQPLANFYWVECVSAYTRLNVFGKVVLDIGADFGVSPYFFLSHGATKVIAYELDPQRRAILASLVGADPAVEIHGGWKGETPAADVLKMDIDGGEAILTADILSHYPQFAVGIHTTLPQPIFNQLSDILTSQGGRVITSVENIEFVYCNA